MYLYNNIVHYDFLLLYEMKQGLTLRSRYACFSGFPLLFFPSVRKEKPGLSPSMSATFTTTD